MELRMERNLKERAASRLQEVAPSVVNLAILSIKPQFSQFSQF